MRVRRPRRPGPVLVLIAILAVGIGLLIIAGLKGTVVYYRTPTEVSQSSESGSHTVRLGGQVMLGSLSRDGDVTRFRLTDGHTQLLVVARGTLPDTFREGQGAVVEGELAPDGTFQARSVAVKHSNEYRPPVQRAALRAGG